jgi:ribosomal-protein-alanine N-acetyltransferase
MTCRSMRQCDANGVGVIMQVRAYQPEDFDGLYELDQTCFVPGIAYSRAMLRYFLTQESARCLLAEDDEEIAGFILGETNGSRGHIITLDVGAEYRRRGLGTQLLNALEGSFAAMGVRSMLIETAMNNEAGVMFWKRHGYRVEGVLKRYYLSRIDAYQMAKSLAVKRKKKVAAGR